MRDSSRRRHDPGFTLAELLVVVSMLAILAGFLLPALARAKGQGRRVQCLNNLKQLTLTWTMYADDNRDYLPLNGNGQPGAIGGNVFWAPGDTHWYLPPFTNVQMLLDPRFASFASYLTAPAVYKCPEDTYELRQLSAPPGGQRPRKVRSYSLNGYIGSKPEGRPLPLFSEAVLPGYKVFMKMSHFNLRSPASFFVFVDVQPNSLCAPAFYTYMTEAGVDGFCHYPSSLHNRRGPLTFADGHADTRLWRDARTRKSDDRGILAHWDQSPHNPDVSWLREHATRKEQSVR